MTSRAIQPLIKANVAILSQKIALLDSLVAKYGSKEASSAFQKICPIVGASIGQHYRHSMDHLELAALLASHQPERVSDIDPKQFLELSAKPLLHYDLRVRGGTLEKDLVESRKRIVNVVDVFENMQSTKKADDFTSISVTAFFNLTADSNDEIGLPSTIGRELGFVAHHAIHHMALVKIIAMHTLGFKENDLPVGFGRAPSTILFDKQQ